MDRAVDWLWEKAFMCHFIVSSPEEAGNLGVYLRREIPSFYIADILLSTQNTSKPHAERVEEFADYYARTFIKTKESFRANYIANNWHGIFTPEVLQERRPESFWGKTRERTGQAFIISDPRPRYYTGYLSWL